MIILTKQQKEHSIIIAEHSKLERTIYKYMKMLGEE